MHKPVGLLVSLFATGLIAVVPAISAGAPGAQDAPCWGTYQGNAAHSGYVPVTLDPSQFRLAWQASVGSSSLNPIAQGDGLVFVSQPGHYNSAVGLHVLDAATGQEKWSTTFGRVFSINPPAYADGKVFIQTGHGLNSSSPPPYLSAFNASDGTLVFRSQFSAQAEYYLAPTPFGGNVYISGGAYGGMYSFNGSIGQQNWFGSVPQCDGWTPAIDGACAYSYTRNGNTAPIRGVFQALNLANGTMAANVVDPIYNENGSTVNAAIALGSNHDAFTINGGRLMCWDTTLDATHTPYIAWSATNGYTGQPTVANGRVYALAGGTLNVLDEDTGSVLWQWRPAGGVLQGTMIVTDSHLFVETSSTVYAVDLASHQSVWSYAANGPLALSEGKLYVAGSNGTVTAISVPEPSTFVLLGMGAVGLLGFARRRRRRTTA
jgi:hypothetical protein